MDIKLVETGSGGSIQFVGTDFESVSGFGSMVYISLFGGNMESTPAIRKDGQQLFDWWGNSTLLKNNRSLQINSLTERTLMETVLNSKGRITIQNAVKADLKWMLEFAEVSVDVDIVSDSKVKISIKIKEPDSVAEEFQFLWDGQQVDFGNQNVIKKISQTGVPGVCPPSRIFLNSNDMGLVPAGGTGQFNIVDSNMNPIGTKISDDTVQVPASAASVYSVVDRWGNPLPNISASVNYSTHNFISDLLASQPSWINSTIEDAMAALIASCVGVGYWTYNKLHGLYMNSGSTSGCHSMNARWPFSGRAAYQAEFGVNVLHSQLGCGHFGGDITAATEIYLPNLVHSNLNALSFGACFTSNQADLGSTSVRPVMQNNHIAAINRGNQLSVRPSDERWLIKANSPGGGGPSYTPGSPTSDYTGMRVAVTRENGSELKFQKNGVVVATIANVATNQDDSATNINSTTWRIGNAGGGSLEMYMGAFYIGQLTAAEAAVMDGFLATFEAAVR